MVTSRAVVGSSAISSSGFIASAMAIITRWRWPPENWCGYWLARLLGFGNAHALQEAHGLRSRPRPAPIDSCACSASAIWRPIV